MKIFFRYLLMRLVQPFFIGLSACSVIWIMVDLYSNVDVFIEHRVAFLKVLYFYSLQIPEMFVTILPATVLFTSLFTLLNLNRRSELIALQAGGISTIRLFLPFFLFGALMVLFLGADMAVPAPWAEAARDRILKQVKGDSAGRDEFFDLAYVDRASNTVWFLQKINANSGRAEGVEILFRTHDGKDVQQYFANGAEWDADRSFWRLHNVKIARYYQDDQEHANDVESEKTLALLDLPDLNTPPAQLISSSELPEQLSLWQLDNSIAGSNLTEKNLAKYRTEWWQRICHPFSVLVFMFYALSNGVTTDRRSTMAGVGVAIGVQFSYLIVMYVFISLGSSERFPAPLAAMTAPLFFGVLGGYQLAKKNGWLVVWQRLILQLWTEQIAPRLPLPKIPHATS